MPNLALHNVCENHTLVIVIERYSEGDILNLPGLRTWGPCDQSCLEANWMTKTLYIGNLPENISQKDLAEFFSQYTQVVSSCIVIDRETGHSKGFGFVEIPPEDAKRLNIELNGKEFDGRSLTVIDEFYCKTLNNESPKNPAADMSTGNIRTLENSLK